MKRNILEYPASALKENGRTLKDVPMAQATWKKEHHNHITSRLSEHLLE
jgi:hypothetical protein